MSYRMSRYDGSIASYIPMGVENVKVNDVVGFYADPPESVTTVVDGKKVQARKRYRGVVVYVHPSRRWCTVQYGHNLRTTLYFSQVVPTNYTAIQVAVIDSALSEDFKERIRKAANSAGVWVAEKQFIRDGVSLADEIGDQCIADVIRDQDTNKLQYIRSFSLISPTVSNKYPECMVCDTKAILEQTVSEETLNRLFRMAQPPENIEYSPLYVREYVTN